MNALASNLLPCFTKIQLQQSGPGEECTSMLSMGFLKLEEIELIPLPACGFGTGDLSCATLIPTKSICLFALKPIPWK